MIIESLANEKIKKYAKLKQKKYRDEYNLFIVEGEHLVEEAIKNNAIEQIYSLDERPNSLQVTENVMKKLSNLDSVPKVLAICKKQNNAEVKGNILILDDIQDPGNLGTIIRSAKAFGIDTIVSSKNTVDLYNIKVLRATEGMIFNLNYLTADLKEFITNLKGYTIYGTNVVNGTNLHHITIQKPYAIIMGNEGNGVSEEIQKLVNQNIYIPMDNKCESLNVGVATSIILYELGK